MSLTFSKENRSQICGRIWLPNCKPLVFYSTQGKQEVLRELLRGQCETLASRYHTQTYYFPLKTPVSWEEFEDLFIKNFQDKPLTPNLSHNSIIN